MRQIQGNLKGSAMWKFELEDHYHLFQHNILSFRNLSQLPYASLNSRPETELI